jgi:hypothetical protein
MQMILITYAGRRPRQAKVGTKQSQYSPVFRTCCAALLMPHHTVGPQLSNYHDRDRDHIFTKRPPRSVSILKHSSHLLLFLLHVAISQLRGSRALCRRNLCDIAHHHDPLPLLHSLCMVCKMLSRCAECSLCLAVLQILAENAMPMFYTMSRKMLKSVYRMHAFRICQIFSSSFRLPHEAQHCPCLL